MLHEAATKAILSSAILLIAASCSDAPTHAPEAQQGLAEFDCPRSELEISSLPEVDDKSISQVRIGDRSIVIVRPQTSEKIDRVVVFFHGGPKSKFVNDGEYERISGAFGGSGTHLIQVGYSATEMPFYSGTDNLERFGLGAIECDVKLVSLFIEQQSQWQNSELPLFAAGTSFGSVAALRLATLNSNIDGAVLFAPWLFPLTLEQILAVEIDFISGGKIIPAKARHRLEPSFREFNAMLKLSGTGVGGQGDDYLTFSRAAACRTLTSPLLLLAAQHEDRADLEKSQEYLRCFANQQAEMIIVERAFHGVELQFPDSRERVERFVDAAHK